MNAADDTGIPLSLYVHLPWCVAKCPYCDFNSHAVPRDGLPERAYTAALLADLEFAAEAARGRRLVSVFFGGGTPSLFTAESIARVLARARELLGVVPDVEVTLEANPGAVEHARFAEYRAAGVNRVSLGAQSFDDARLAALGRIHAASETCDAVAELRSAGIDNLNLDLMYALPGQDVAAALADLEHAIALEPTHLSHYQLTLEPGTAFYHRPPALPDDELGFEIQLACQDRLAAAGYAQYEVSGYARAGQRCLHNLNYWQFGDYLGIGAGAHAKLTNDAPHAIVRSARVRSPVRYLGALDPAERIEASAPVASAELPFEYFLNALRLNEGFDWAQFEARTGLDRGAAAATCDQAAADGLLEPVSGRSGWRPTELGRRFLNDLQARFLR
jgi:putative oxygen-independent coproporphyrinogen III oxidase